MKWVEITYINTRSGVRHIWGKHYPDGISNSQIRREWRAVSKHARMVKMTVIR